MSHICKPMSSFPFVACSSLPAKVQKGSLGTLITPPANLSKTSGIFERVKRSAFIHSWKMRCSTQNLVFTSLLVGNTNESGHTYFTEVVVPVSKTILDSFHTISLCLDAILLLFRYIGLLSVTSKKCLTETSAGQRSRRGRRPSSYLQTTVLFI